MYEFLLVFGVVLWLTVWIVYVRKPVASMYHPLTYYLMVHGLVFVIRPILAYHYNFDGLYIFYEFMPTIEEKSTVLAGADVGLIAFAIASLAMGKLPIDIRFGMVGEVLSPAVIRSFLIACVICLPLGVYSLSSILRGTAGEMATDIGSGVVYNVTGNGYFSDAQLMVGPICATFAWVFRFRLWALMPFLAYVAAKASTGGRGPFVQAFVMLCLLYYYKSNKKWPNVRILIPVIAVFALFSAIGADRAVIRNIFTGVEIASVRYASTDRPLESMDYGNMEFFEYLVHTIPEKTGTFGYFIDNLQVFTEPVPRVLWQNKPFGPPIQMYDLFAYGNPFGMTMSVPGEGWAQGGWVGIVLWCGLFGMFYGRMYTLFIKSKNNGPMTAIYAVLLSSTIVTFRDGALLSVLKNSLFSMLPLIMWSLLLRLDEFKVKT